MSSENGKKCGGDCSTCACKAKKKLVKKPNQTEILELLALAATMELINKKPNS